MGFGRMHLLVVSVVQNDEQRRGGTVQRLLGGCGLVRLGRGRLAVSLGSIPSHARFPHRVGTKQKGQTDEEVACFGGVR